MPNKHITRLEDIPLVAILLCTYNGEKFLREQLNSIKSQEHKNFTLWASDDGSNDNTLKILNEYRNLWGEDRLTIYAGPEKGFAANFLSLICNPHIEADYYAFADQDDIWEPNKLSHGIKHLHKLPKHRPAIYSGRTCFIDEQGKKIGYSPLFKKQPGFGNALVQSIATGNTMVMNRAARDLICEIGETPIVSHDWWAYILITGVDGTFIYDPQPTVLYRQHESNIVGGSIKLNARLKKLLSSQFKEYNTINAIALKQAYTHLSSENKLIFKRYNIIRTRAIIPRLTSISRSDIYRQTLIGNIGLLAAIILNKF